MPTACRRALLAAPLLFVLAFLSGCRPSYERRPWTLAYQYDDVGLRLPTIAPLTGPIFYETLQPEGAAPSPTGTHLLMATQEGALWIYDAVGTFRSQRIADKGVTAQFWPEVSPWSPDGQAFVYVQGGNLMYQHLTGSAKPLTTTGDVFTAAISPDGTRLAFGRKSAKDDDLGLWVIPVTGGEAKLLVDATHDIFHACCPHWSPDGKWIAFLQAFEGGALGVVAADGTDVRTGIDAAWEPVRWLPDNKTVVFTRILYGEPGDGVHAYNLDAKKTTLVTGSGRNASYALSPDATQAVVVSWKEASAGKVSDPRIEIVSVATGAVQGDAVKLAGAARHVTWAPDGKQIAVLVDAPNGKATVLRSQGGLAQLQPAGPDASALAGWVREWRPKRPWWKFWAR